MKLIQEYIIKIVILIVVSIVAIEGIITYLLVNRAKIIFDATYSETIEKSEAKSIEITKKIEEYATNLLTRYMTDLKLICKHSQLLSGGKTFEMDTVVDLNENLDFFKILINKYILLLWKS